MTIKRTFCASRVFRGISFVTILFTLIFLVGTFSSCRRKDIFSKEVYKGITHGVYPVDTLDEFNTWSLLKNMMVRVTADIPIDDLEKVEILSANPYGLSSEILAEEQISFGETKWLAFDLPNTQEAFCAALVTKGGKYYVKEFPVSDTDLSFSSGGVINSGTFYKPSYQTYTYLFEQSFPNPTDFDYNDVVLRISKQAMSESVLNITVTLAAASAPESMAGLIRLPDIPYDMVENVKIIEGTPMDYEYPMTRFKLNTNKTLTKGRDGKAVIALFECAHWSLSHETMKMGNIAYIKYNTTHYENEGEALHKPIQTRTYEITVKEGLDVRYLPLSDIDPFLITTYNSVYFEIHTYPYKFDEVIWEYIGKDKRAYDDHLAWALLIPDATFRYPIEEMPLGTFRNGELFGAYGKYNHSFGQWCRNHETSIDWWQNAASAMVY